MRNGPTGVLPCSCSINISNSGGNNTGFQMKTRKPGETGMLLMNGRAASLRRHHWKTVACLRMTSIALDRLMCSSKTQDKPQPLLTRCRCPPRPVLKLRRALKRRRRGRRRRRPKLRRSRRPKLRRIRRPTMKRRCLPRQRSAASLRRHHRQAIAASLRRHFVPLVHSSSRTYCIEPFKMSEML